MPLNTGIAPYKRATHSPTRRDAMMLTPRKSRCRMMTSRKILIYCFQSQCIVGRRSFLLCELLILLDSNHLLYYKLMWEYLERNFNKGWCKYFSPIIILLSLRKLAPSRNVVCIVTSSIRIHPCHTAAILDILGMKSRRCVANLRFAVINHAKQRFRLFL